jgi:heat shock protein HslJ
MSRTLWTLRIAAVVLTLAVVSLAAGCGGAADDEPSLDATGWRLVGWSLSSLDPNDFTITAAFADGQISGTSAVNSYGGPYTTGPGDAFSVGDIAATAMAGPEPAMRAEGAYMTLLDQAASYTLAGDTLRLYDENGNESLVFTATDG